MKKVIILIFCLFFVQNILAQDTRKPLSDEEIKLKDELKKDKDFQEVNCGFRVRRIRTKSDTTLRLDFYKAFKGKEETNKIKKICGTIEGAPIYSYLILEKNKVKLIADTSEDDYGYKKIYSYQCEKLAFGIYFFDEKEKKWKFQKIEENEVNDKQIFLQCLAGTKELIF